MYRCANGFRVKGAGDERRSCQATTGHWTGQQVVCVRKSNPDASARPAFSLPSSHAFLPQSCCCPFPHSTVPPSFPDTAWPGGQQSEMCQFQCHCFSWCFCILSCLLACCLLLPVSASCLRSPSERTVGMPPCSSLESRALLSPNENPLRKFDPLSPPTFTYTGSSLFLSACVCRSGKEHCFSFAVPLPLPVPLPPLLHDFISPSLPSLSLLSLSILSLSILSLSILSLLGCR